MNFSKFISLTCGQKDPEKNCSSPMQFDLYKGSKVESKKPWENFSQVCFDRTGHHH